MAESLSPDEGEFSPLVLSEQSVMCLSDSDDILDFVGIQRTGCILEETFCRTASVNTVA